MKFPKLILYAVMVYVLILKENISYCKDNYQNRNRCAISKCRIASAKYE